jgi:hypothetical protein
MGAELNRTLRTCALAIALLGCAQGALAQGLPAGMVPPRRVTDARGVDLVGGQFLVNVPLVSFGEHATSLSAWLETSPGVPPISGNFQNNAGYMIAGAIRPQAFTIGADGSPDEFGAYENIVFPTGAGLAQQLLQYPRYNVDGSFSIHTNPDGSRYTHSFGTSHFTRLESTDPNLTGVYDAQGNRGLIDQTSPFLDLFQKIVFANGEEWRFWRQFVTVPCLNCQVSTTVISRIRYLTSSRGYGIQFLYLSDTTPPANGVAAGSWSGARRVTAYNKAVTYCNEALLQECTAVSALPSAEIIYDGNAATVTVREPGATEGVEFFSTGSTLSMRQTAVPNSTVSIQVAVDNAGVGYTSRVTDADGQWNYSRITYVDDSGHQPLMTASSVNPAGGTVQIFGYGIFGTIQWYGDELNRYYNYADGFPFRDWGRSEPENDLTEVGRDERNNITAITRYPKPNSNAQPMLVYQASYPVHCTNPRTCNRPASTTDANNNTTDYTYAPEHGGVLTETGPAVNGVRPQKRYEYAQRTAWTGNGSGGYAAGPPIWLRVRERACRTTAASGASCAGGAADEVITDYDYGPNSGPNTLLLRGIAVTAHDGTQIATLRTCYGYDARGNRISTTLPNANLGSCS